MSPQPRVTVLMTVYNGLPYLREAVESVLAQAFADFEFLIIDDASSDGSWAWLQGARDARMRLARNDRNRGQVRSLNHGLSLASGECVARLDQDDACLPTRLGKQVAWLDAHPDAAAVGTLMTGMGPEGRRNGWTLGRRQPNYGSFVASLLLGLTPVCHPSVMFRRERIQQLGGYDESFAPAEDVELWARLAIHRQYAGVIAEPLVRCRMHPGQQSVTKAAAQQNNLWRAQERLVEAWCPEDARAPMAALWRREARLWSVCRSKSDWIRLSRAMQEMTDRLAFTPEEQAVFVRMADRWLGPGIRLARRARRLPSWLFYPALAASSPLLLPGLRSSLSKTAGAGRRLRCAMAAQRSAVTVDR